MLLNSVKGRGKYSPPGATAAAVAEEEDEEEAAEAEEVGGGGGGCGCPHDAAQAAGWRLPLSGAGCDLRLFDFESFGGFGKEVVRSTLSEGGGEPAEQQTFACSASVRGHMDNQELARPAAFVSRPPHRCGVADGERASVRGAGRAALIVHGAECIAVLNGVA